MDLTIVALIGLGIMLALIFLGVNVGLSMMIVGFFGYMYIRDWNSAYVVMGTYTVSSTMIYSLTVIPLFVLMGNFAFHSGISDDLFNTSRTLFGRVRGSLAYAAVWACALFGAICGSLVATTATMSRVAKPVMTENKYSDKVIGGTLACSGTLGTLIPPSTPFIIYGLMSETSIGKLFAAGVFPGIIMAASFSAVILLWSTREKESFPTGRSYTGIEKIKSLKGFAGMFVLFFLVLGAMFSGITSVTEAAAIGALASLVILFLRRRSSKKVLLTSFFDTAKTVGMVMLTIVGAGVFGTFLTLTNLPSNIAAWVQTFHISPILVVALIIAIYGLLGCVMDTLALMLLSIPIFMPLVNAIGLDPIWFGVIIVMIMNLGAITPPVGMSCYVASSVMGIQLGTVFRGAIPFLIAFAVSFVIVLTIPGVSLWLPSMVV